MQLEKKSNPSVREVLEFWVFPQLSGIEKQGRWRWRANCPAHADKRGCLAVSVDDGNLELRCGRGCTLYAICEALSIAGRARTAMFPQHHARLFWEHQDHLERNPGALLEHYREAVRAGVRLPKQQQVEFRNLAALTARKSA